MGTGKKTGKKEVAVPSAAGNRLPLALLIFAVLCITIPFLTKAFHLDDTFFVRLAQWKLAHPLALGLPDHGYEGNFFSLYLDTHPPLLTSYMSLLIRVFGGASEIGLHLGFLVFPAVAAVSMFFLARRFTHSPLLSALLLVVTPGFMVMAQSVMTDVPAVALWLAAIAAYVFAVDRKDNRLLIISGVFISLAILTTYQSFSLVTLLFLYAWLQRRHTLRNMMPLVAGLAIFGAIVVYYLAATGGPPKLSYSIGLNLAPAFLANKILATVSVIGGATVFPLVLAAGMLKGKKEYLAFGALLAALLIFFLTKVSSGEYTAAAAFLQAIFCAAGLLAIYRFANKAMDEAVDNEKPANGRDSIFLVLWIGGVLLYNVILLPYASTRYLLPLFPPVILMFVRYSGGVISSGRNWTIFAAAAVALTAGAGFAVSAADYQLANVYRSFSSDYSRQLQTGNHKLWFAGEFGLRYYLEENGGRYLTRDDGSPAAGDHVVLSHGLIAYFISDDLKRRLQLEQSVNYPGSWPVRVEDPGSQAGFYDQFHGNLPYSLARQPIETIDVYVVK
ncbi:MAG: glycosyltransferase family 39 protein [Actinobacteria bacterium]|nr:glycosyltransferase family 39 protein [Actinomycetota bacterium]